jgi:hypothetical protein
MMVRFFLLLLNSYYHFLLNIFTWKESAMGPAQGFLHPTHRAGPHQAFRLCISLILLLLSVISQARAQSEVPVVSVATDAGVSGLLSNQFGVPDAQAINQVGDLVFVGRGGSALFFRAAGSATPSRLLQAGEAIPGVAGSQVTSFAARVGINLSAKIVFSVNYSLPDARPHQALMTYDGSTFHKIISSDDVAPAGDGTFGNTILPIPLGPINDNGDIAFSAAPTGTTVFTLYIVPAGGAPDRIVAARDFIPSSQTQLFLRITPISGLNSLGQLLVSGFTNSGTG